MYSFVGSSVLKEVQRKTVRYFVHNFIRNTASKLIDRTFSDTHRLSRRETWFREKRVRHAFIWSPIASSIIQIRKNRFTIVFHAYEMQNKNNCKYSSVDFFKPTSYQVCYNFYNENYCYIVICHNFPASPLPATR